MWCRRIFVMLSAIRFPAPSMIYMSEQTSPAFSERSVSSSRAVFSGSQISS